ncbi:MAG: helix-turn-helix transcriptional regulator, partial [Clostridia bacterium]|nr:helix-turn-helix transcriptional regulator [Clostridia bacterium]
RVYKACSQLRMTDDPVTEIAYSCGFGDLSYFIKQFKSTYGLSPAAFRKIQKNIPDT